MPSMRGPWTYAYIRFDCHIPVAPLNLLRLSIFILIIMASKSMTVPMQEPCDAELRVCIDQPVIWDEDIELTLDH